MSIRQSPSSDVCHSWEAAEGAEVTGLLSHQVSEVGWSTTCRLQLHFCSSDCSLGKPEVKSEQKLQARRKDSGEWEQMCAQFDMPSKGVCVVSLCK